MKAAVTRGSPFSFGVQPGLRRFIETVGPALKLKSIPITKVSGLARFGPPPGPIVRYLMREANMDPLVVKKAMFNMAADIPGGVGRQFARWITTGNFDSLDGRFDYRKNLTGVKIPFLLIAGSRDLLAPPLSVARAQRARSSPDRVTHETASPARPHRIGAAHSSGGLGCRAGSTADSGHDLCEFVPDVDARDQRIAELEGLLKAALAEIAALRAEVAELKGRLGQNSSNSSKPPSSDPPGTERKASPPTGRMPGGQPGHKHHKRELIPPEQVSRLVATVPASVTDRVEGAT